MNENLKVERDGRVLRVTLQRSAKRNALDSAMCRSIVDAVDQAQDDKQTGAILIDAAGPVFCAGMDLEEAALAGAAERTAIHQQLFTMGLRSLKPIVAAVQGPALGGGVGLILTAHVVVAAQGSSFGLTEIRTGMWPFVIFRNVAHAIGERRALELSLTGRIFTAPDALTWGMIHHLVPAFELEDRAFAIAEGIANSSPAAIRRGLSALRDGRELPAAEQTELAARFRAEQFDDPDFAEGVRAFLEKRSPVWPSLG